MMPVTVVDIAIVTLCFFVILFFVHCIVHCSLFVVHFVQQSLIIAPSSLAPLLLFCCNITAIIIATDPDC